jgi:hypothetical protein
MGMRKKISAVVLAGIFAMPMTASAVKQPEANDLSRKVEELSRELEELKAAMAAQKNETSQTAQKVNQMENVVIDLSDRSDNWDVASRFQFSGDFRTRMDYYSADTALGNTLSNDTIWTNRLRINMAARATENLEFKGRLAMYKAWGMQSAFTDDSGSMWPVFDGNVTRTPSDSALYVDRAIINWDKIGGTPVWFSIGRRPTTDGPPAETRMGTDHRMATPVNYMDWPFDGLTLGYRYKWGNEDLGTGALRFCYGRGFENGLQLEKNVLDDTDFAGFAWDVLNKGSQHFNIQSFMAFNLFNYPNFQDPVINANFGSMSGMGDRTTAGNLLHTSAVYQNKASSLNYFVAGGWSRSLPDDSGLFNDVAGMAMGLNGPDTKNENGYSIYLGVRYDIDSIGLKVGTEYNWGSEYWLAMTPGHDEIYQSKLAARGSVYEVYGIYDLPTGEAVSKYAKTFIRFGYQHYDYNYAGSGNWNIAPYDLSDSADLMKLQAMGMDPVKSADQIYVSLEAYF